MIIIKIKEGLLFSVAMFLSTLMMAQFSAGSNLSIDEKGVVYIHGQHSFSTGGGFVNAGVIKTSRTGAKGYLIFTKGSSWKDASSTAFVDGYVQVLHNQPFIFPTGHGTSYRPVAISGAKNTTAAYYHKNPVSAIGKVVKNSAIHSISTKEYWEVRGQSATKITLTWGKESDIESLTKGQLNKLAILGWSNGAWKSIPSAIQPKNQGSIKDFYTGSITTKKEIIPSDYEYLTLGTLLDKKTEAAPTVSVFPNPVVNDIYINISQFKDTKGTIAIYNYNGQKIKERTITLTSKDMIHFDASAFTNGIYEITIATEDNLFQHKFVVNHTY